MKTVSITVDVEDWFHAVKLRHLFPIENWSTKKLLVVEPLAFILDTLEQLNIKATFFVLGWIAETHPEIVKDIHSRGHEMASYGMTHVPNNILSDKEDRQELHHKHRGDRRPRLHDWRPCSYRTGCDLERLSQNRSRISCGNWSVRNTRNSNRI